ncbi:PH domain-containing protein [Nocardia sp. NPDC050697]|uniref:PH domain-containing protein n=1 Tax=Nocardia sp. NPDC050697 TaxID=3155158 RepID=UPI0033E72104
MPVVRIRRRAAAAPEPDWDLEVRPRKAVRTARIVAVVLLILFVIAGTGMRNAFTGVNFRVIDQIAMYAIGVLAALTTLLLTRPRVRVGPRGVAVRNVLGDHLFGWEHVRGVSFPDRKAWARLELEHDEYVPMLAVRANDGQRAVDALDRIRELGAKYTAA